jgi:hypothetical protein
MSLPKTAKSALRGFGEEKLHSTDADANPAASNRQKIWAANLIDTPDCIQKENI